MVSMYLLWCESYVISYPILRYISVAHWNYSGFYIVLRIIGSGCGLYTIFWFKFQRYIINLTVEYFWVIMDNGVSHSE